MRDSITILEKRELNLDGELLKTTYVIHGAGEFDHIRTFSSYEEARKYIKNTHGI
jgi:isopentenyl phosphate kinase